MTGPGIPPGVLRPTESEAAIGAAALTEGVVAASELACYLLVRRPAPSN